MSARMNPPSSNPVQFALGGLVAMAIGMGIGRFIFTPILPGMMTELGLTPGDAGIIASANYVGYLLGAIIAGLGWASGIERPLVYLSIAASAALCFAMSVSDGVAVFSIVRFFAGVASAFMLVFTATIVFSHLAVANRQDLQAVHFGGVGSGIALSSLLVAFSSASGFGWRENWIAAAILSALGLLAVLMLIRQGPGAQRRSGNGTARRLDVALYQDQYRLWHIRLRLHHYGNLHYRDCALQPWRGRDGSAGLAAHGCLRGHVRLAVDAAPAQGRSRSLRWRSAARCRPLALLPALSSHRPLVPCLAACFSD